MPRYFCLTAHLLWLTSIGTGMALAIESTDDAVLAILRQHCFDCHSGDNVSGNVALDRLDELPDDQRKGVWWAVLKNVRADIMPPHPADRIEPQEKSTLLEWVKTSHLGIDSADLDPGRTTLRRLNRVEYRNTIRDLMGVDYDTMVEFPPDDTGHGFDTIADALTLSPLLLEKYLQAAEEIVEQSVPQVSRILPQRTYGGGDFKSVDQKQQGGHLSFYQPAEVEARIETEELADYRIQLDLQVDGGFDFDPGRCRVHFSIDGVRRWTEEFGWQESKGFQRDVPATLIVGSHNLRFQLEPLFPESQQQKPLHFRVRSVRLQGPLDRSHWRTPPGYDRFFHRPEAPADEAERHEYAREILRAFTKRAFRRPAEDEYIERLARMAWSHSELSGKTFEAGIARAMVAVLASPRFVFRIERLDDDGKARYPELDEYALASRLSYLFWSTMPDDTLIQLADTKQLRLQLDAQIDRLLRDPRAEAFIRNFVGQWLQTRDVESISIDPLSAIGAKEEYEALRDKFFSRFRRRDPNAPRPPEPPQDAESVAARERLTELRAIRDSLDARLRKAMRRETEMLFEHLVRDDRSVLELIDADYTFLNEPLAKHYGIPDVKGDEMRRVELPADSRRGGVLTQASFLMVTSNPTRTSPVKRGLFILDNILGTPAPPAPAAVPVLEAAKEAIKDHEPTLREVLELHRKDPLCHSCHQRFDPLGLALENFNALGMWRDQEQSRPIEVAGSLITGEEFGSLDELKTILCTSRRLDFYRCLTQKMLTYSLGRGLESHDEETVDRIVDQLDRDGGRFSSLLRGVIHSAPFQRQRRVSVEHEGG